MFESRLELFERQLKLEGEIEWIKEDGDAVVLRRILFAYAWDPEVGGPVALKVGVASNLAEIDRLARELVPAPPADPAWEDLLEAIGRNMDDNGYDAPAAMLFNATDEVLSELSERLQASGYEDLQQAVEDEDVASLLFGFQSYEMEGLEVGLA